MQDAFTSGVVALRAAAEELLAAPVLTDPGDRRSVVARAADLREAAEAVVVAAVNRARSEGASWRDVGDALGVTRQAAFQRYGKPIDPRNGEAMSTTPLSGAAALAQQVIDDLAAGRWSAVTTRFDATMTEGLPEDALAAAWAQVVGQVGALEHVGTPDVTRAADVTVTSTSLEHEAGELVARISFRDDASVAGLFLLKPELA